MVGQCIYECVCLGAKIMVVHVRSGETYFNMYIFLPDLTSTNFNWW